MDMYDFDTLAGRMAENIRATIVSERKLRRWDQIDLARESGVSLQQVGRFERGEREPRMRDLVKLAAAFGLTLGGFASLADENARRVAKGSSRHPGTKAQGE